MSGDLGGRSGQPSVPKHRGFWAASCLVRRSVDVVTKRAKVLQQLRERGRCALAYCDFDLSPLRFTSHSPLGGGFVAFKENRWSCASKASTQHTSSLCDGPVNLSFSPNQAGMASIGYPAPGTPGPLYRWRNRQLRTPKACF